MSDGFKKRRQFAYAVMALAGMIIGAGTFGIPFVVAQAGFISGFFYFLLLGSAVMVIHLFYGEISLRTNQPHCLVGFASKYLGQRAKKIATAVILLEFYGSLLAYIILGGEFLNIIFRPFFGSAEVFWALVFFLAGAAAIFYGIKSVVKNEFFLTGLLFLAISILIFKGLILSDISNFRSFNLTKLFLPYGVFLFAMTGSAAIPGMRNIMKGQERDFKKAIIIGTLIPIIIYFLFAWAVVGTAGIGTSEDAISGLVPFMGKGVIVFGAIVGILAVFTSFLILGFELNEVFRRDYRIKKTPAYLLSLAVPVLAYLAGFKSFIFIIGFIGGVAAGLDGIITVLIYYKAKKIGDRQPEYQLFKSKFLGYALILLFAVGIIYEVVYTILKIKI